MAAHLGRSQHTHSCLHSESRYDTWGCIGGGTRANPWWCYRTVKLNLPQPCVGMKPIGAFKRLGKSQPKTFWDASQKAISSARRSKGPTRRVTTMMPMGVPKVVYTPPGQRKGDWVDLWEAYQNEKVVFLINPITEEVANNMIALSLYLDSVDKKRIYWWINCPGGEVTPTLALYDTMQYLRCKSATVGYGMCLGMAGLLLSTGEKGYRFAWPNTILMLHHPSGAARGQASDMHDEMRELVRIRDYLTLLASHSTGQPYDKVLVDMSRNKWMTPKEAVDYGMIDKVLYAPRVKTIKAPTGPSVKFARQGVEGTEIF